MESFLFSVVAFCAILIIYAFIINPIADKTKEYNQQQEKEKERREKISELSNLENEQKKYAHLEGLQKYYQMNNDDVQKYQRGIEAMRELGMIMQRSVYQEKEKDWAIWGGIADGIAGPIAGIATAVNTMSDNKRIQSENATRREWGRKQNEFYQDLANQAQSECPRSISMMQLEKKYDTVLSWKPTTLFSLIKIKSTENKVDTQTGAVTVNVNWEQEDKSVCIDGSLRAKLYTKDGMCAGCAFLVLPKMGTVGFKGTLSGICVSPKPSTEYTVKIEPCNLWELAPKGSATFRNNDNLTDDEHRRLVSNSENDFLAEMQ